jgi:zinc D-Ala-D-Ala carboxypeptidase
MPLENKITKWKYFDPATDSKMTCSCGCGRMDLKDSFMQKMVRIREKVGVALFVTSGSRCPDHNNKVSSTGYWGPHTTGRAIDVAAASSRIRFLLIKAALEEGITRIGIGKTFLHFDDLTKADGFDEDVIWHY